jgi:hypothetical protein
MEDPQEARPEPPDAPHGKELERSGAAVGQVTEGGIELASALAGGGVGLIGGPAGALGGAALGVVLSRGLKAAVTRFVTRREEERMGAAVALIAADAERRSGDSERPRTDGFFDDQGQLRPDAEELLEGVLRHAAQAYEERKVLVLANFYSGLAHDDSVDAPEAHLLLQQIAALTYRQIVALSVLDQRPRYQDFLMQTQTMHTETRGHPGGDPTVEVELSALAASQLVGVETPDRGTVPLTSTIGGLGGVPASVGYQKLALLRGGEVIARLARLAETVDDEQRESWLHALRGPDVL